MIYQLLHTIAEKDKNQTALVFEEKKYTYGQLLQKANELYDELLALGIEQSNICLFTPNHLEAIVCLFAIARSNNSVTPIDYFSSSSELAEFLSLYPSDYVIYHQSLAAKLNPEFEQIKNAVCLKNTANEFLIFKLNGTVISSSYNRPSWFKKILSGNKDVVHSPTGDANYMNFSSSGSSGQPKVFPLTNSQLFHQFVQVRDNFQFMSTDKVLCALHYSHNHAICLIFSVLAAGGTAHLIPVEKALAPFISNYIYQHKITLFSHVPLIYKAFVDVAGHLNTDHLQSLRMAICGSAPLSGEIGQLFYEKFGKHLHQSYGLSEIGPVCVNLFADGEYNYNSVGRIFKEIDYKIVDDNEADVAIGSQGHLLMKGKSMTSGYLKNPAANQLMFKDGWLHSQDIVTEDLNGNISIVGRRSNFINVGGLKVFPAEIERAIMNMEEVKEVAVNARMDDFFGQVAEAYVVIHDGVSLTEADIKKWCNDHLSSFKVPKNVIFLTEMPKNGIGKIISSKLKRS